jgi:hypothetical protein
MMRAGWRCWEGSLPKDHPPPPSAGHTAQTPAYSFFLRYPLAKLVFLRNSTCFPAAVTITTGFFKNQHDKLK